VRSRLGRRIRREREGAARKAEAGQQKSQRAGGDGEEKPYRGNMGENEKLSHN